MADVERQHPFLKLALLIGILVGAALVVRATPLGEAFTREGVIDALQTVRSSMWAPVIFVLLYAAATAVALPGSLLTIAGGAVFGFWLGAVLNTVGANIGANAAFGLARSLGRDGIQRIVGARLQGLDKATVQHGFMGLLVLRLIPLVPFNALNFGSGLTALRWRHYALATVIGILPGTLVYTFFADALVQGSTSANAEARTRLWVAGALFLALALIPVVARRLGFKPKTQSTEVS